MNDLFDTLEICLQELETGADLETVLARYPDLARELRPILKASMATRMMSVPAPSLEVVRRGRAKVLQHALEMREGKLAPRKRMIPIFQRLAISFALTAVFLTTGTGLVGASSSALPGEKLYPLKLTWENVRLFFTFNNEYRESLENSFEDERLKEVSELLSEGKDETIRFAGLYTQVNGIVYVSGIHIVILDTSILPIQPLQTGMAVIVTGHTNAQKFVDVESIELLPVGSAVPTGEPLEVELDHKDGGSESNDVNSNENSNANVNENVNANNNENVNENSNDNTSGSSSETGNDSSDNVNSNSGSNDSSDDSVNSNSGSNEDSGGDSNSNSGGDDSSGGDNNNND